MNLAPFTRFELSTEQKVALCDAMLAQPEVHVHTFRTAQVNYAAIARELDWTEARALKDLDAALTATQDNLIASLNRTFDVKKTKQSWINDLALRGFGAVRTRLQDMVQESTERGVLAVEREVPQGGFKIHADQWVTIDGRPVLIDDPNDPRYVAIGSEKHKEDALKKLDELRSKHPNQESLVYIPLTSQALKYNDGAILSSFVAPTSKEVEVPLKIQSFDPSYSIQWAVFHNHVGAPDIQPLSRSDLASFTQLSAVKSLTASSPDGSHFTVSDRKSGTTFFSERVSESRLAAMNAVKSDLGIGTNEAANWVKNNGAAFEHAVALGISDKGILKYETKLSSSAQKYFGDRKEVIDTLRKAAATSKFSDDNVFENYTSRATVSPKAAIKAMRDKALWVSGVLEGELIKRTQGILTQAIKNGEGLGETIQKVKEAWLPYMGDETIIKDAEQLQPYRLKTIVRTNTTDAYNTGRLAKMRDPDLDEWVQGVRYEAVIDERTTELCADLDGLVFRKDDPDLDRLTPPNHFNCRSLLIPVLIDEQVPADKFVTQRDIGTALDRMDAGFGGVAKYEQPS